ncbi:HepT-like ribonuclease domain-containing protein [Saccharopolyspora pogona]|uniref:HepT-like ribonuclease domain-containing protein n=1 Tax=Saccharopolyspora pogona TaxID=333966 RepID=UPI0016877D7B|nr:HepT-like ribonuclease domain-containing protein [Saccharopolyspora pogona]
MGSIDSSVPLRAIVRGCEMILQFAPADRSDLDSEIVEAALAQCLITMGDAGSDLPVSFRAENDHIPWTDMIALRDRLRHRYWGTTADLLWSEALAIPGLLPQLRAILESAEGR